MTDALTAAAWFVVNLSAAAAATRLARRAFPDDTRAAIAMHALLMLWTSVVALCVLLGAAGLLHWGTLSGLMLLVSGVVALATRQDRAGLVSPSTFHEAPGHRQSSAQASSRKSTIRVTYSRWLWGALAALASAMIVQRLMEFPKYWDDLMYHLPLVDHWLQDGRLYAPGCAEWYNPGNGELLGLWLAAPFSGDYWVGAANLPVAALLTLGVLELGRELKLSSLVRHAVAVATIASNVVLTQLTDLENDMAVSAAFVAALAYGARFARIGRAPDLWLAAASLGLLAGVKYYALGYAAIGGGALIVLFWTAHGNRSARRFAVATVLCAASLAGYWYFRNWVVTGTPVYPLGVSRATDVLESVRPSAFRTTFFGNGRTDLWVQYLSALRQLTGYYQVAGVLMGPAAAVWMLIGAWFGLRGGLDRSALVRVALAIGLLGGIFVFGITPFTVADDNERLINGAFTVVRYSQCPVILGMLCLAVALDAAVGGVRRIWPGRASRIIAAAIGLLAIAAGIAQLAARGRELINFDAILMAVNLGLAGWLLGELYVRSAAHVWRRRLTWTAAAVFVATASTALGHRWHAGYAKNFDRQFATQAFTRLETGDIRARGIAVADYRYYAFFGSRRQFRAHRPFRILSWTALLSYLRNNRIDALAAVRRDPFKYGRYPGIGDLAAEHADVFQKVEAGAGFDVYVVKAPPEALAAVRAKDGSAPAVTRDLGNPKAPH